MLSILPANALPGHLRITVDGALAVLGALPQELHIIPPCFLAFRYARAEGIGAIILQRSDLEDVPRWAAISPYATFLNAGTNNGEPPPASSITTLTRVFLCCVIGRTTSERLW